MANRYLEKIAEKKKSSPEKRLAKNVAATGAVAGGAGGLVYSVGKPIATAYQERRLNQRAVRSINAAKKRAEYHMRTKGGDLGRKGMSPREAANRAIGTINRRNAKIATKTARGDALKVATKAAKGVAKPLLAASGIVYGVQKAHQKLSKGKK